MFIYMCATVYINLHKIKTKNKKKEQKSKMHETKIYHTTQHPTLRITHKTTYK